MGRRKRWMGTIVVGAVIMLAGIILAAFTPFREKILQGGVITIGMVMIVIGVVSMLKKQEGPAKDELTRKIADRAAAYSWVITLMVLLAVFWINHFEVVAFSVNVVIGITYAVMILTMICFQQIFWRRGDVV